MATTKRLNPTGVNMSIPEFTDKPDQRVNSTALGQLADAINNVDSDLDNKIPNTLKLERNSASTTSLSFSIKRTQAGSYSYFLLVGGISASRGFVYHGFVHISGTDTVVLTLIGGTAVAGISATYDGTTLTITATETVWGGMRLIWLS